MSKRLKPCILAINSELRALVIEKLQLNSSPEQISGWFKIKMPRRKRVHISHERIYKRLYVRSRNVLDTALMKYLRRAHKMRQIKRYSRSGDQGTINIVNCV